MNTFPSMHSSLRSVALVSFACLLGAAQALAAEPGSPRSVTVNYGDLNLSTVAGATTLYRRIRGAAEMVCGHEGRRFDEHTWWTRCYRGAIADAVAAVNSPLLSAVYSEHGGKSTVTAMLTR